MSDYNKEELVKDLTILSESKVKKKKILIDCFQEIETALNNGASMEEVLDTIKKRTGQTIHQRYAYLVLQEQREGQTKTAKPNTQTVPVNPVVVEQTNTPIKQAAPASVEVKTEQPPTQESKKERLDPYQYYMKLPYDELPEMIKEKARLEIAGVIYDVRSPEPPYKSFGSHMDDFNFSSQMKELGHDRNSQEYKEAFKVIIKNKDNRLLYTDAHRIFKERITKYEKDKLEKEGNPPTTAT